MRIRRAFRLLPAVILVGAGLLALKSVTLVQDARAQTAMTGQAPAPAPKDTTHVAVSDPVIDDSESNSAAEIDVLTSLSRRRQQLDARAQSLDMQANLIAATEERVNGKIATLKDLQAQLQTLLGQRDAAQKAQLTALVKSYSAMRPADAARIFDTLDETVELNVAAQMKSDVLGAILAKMQSDAAEKLTVRLANRLKLPQAAPAAVAVATTPQAPAQQQMAALNPAAPTVQAPATANPPPATGPMQQVQPQPANAAVPPATQETAPLPKKAEAAAAKPAEAKPAARKEAAPKEASIAKPALEVLPKERAKTAPPKQPAKKQAASSKSPASKPPAAKPKNG